MACFGCNWDNWRALSQAAAKSAAARFRSIGGLRTESTWSVRAALCESCPIRHVSNGVTYCGKPFLEQIERHDPSEGCGCPTRDKAKTPGEHCPLDARHRPAIRLAGHCTCKWCRESEEPRTK